MDEQPRIERGPGGNLEPLDHGFRERSNPPTLPEERFELHDPRTELTYRTRNFVEMVTKANQIGALRFTAIAPGGKRSIVSRVEGAWRRDPAEVQAPAVVERKPELSVEAPTSPASPARVVTKDSNDAARIARLSEIEAALSERYVIKEAPIRIGDVTIGQTEYRHRGDTSRIAFTASTFRLSTDNNNPAVARSMIDVAEARGWQSLRVSGNADFLRMVWLESSLRGVKTIGYEPVAADLDLLQKERQARQVNRIERLQGASDPSSVPAAGKQSERGGGRKAVLAALEAVLVAKNVPERQRVAVMAAAAENLTTRLRNGETHRIKVYDRTAPSQRPVATPTREPQRDRGAPAR